jgi:hypothetical protein
MKVDEETLTATEVKITAEVADSKDFDFKTQVQ